MCSRVVFGGGVCSVRGRGALSELSNFGKCVGFCFFKRFVRFFLLLEVEVLAALPFLLVDTLPIGHSPPPPAASEFSTPSFSHTGKGYCTETKR